MAGIGQPACGGGNVASNGISAGAAAKATSGASSNSASAAAYDTCLP